MIEKILTSGLRELSVTDGAGRLIGYVDDQTIAHAYWVVTPAIDLAPLRGPVALIAMFVQVVGLVLEET